jgi:cation:H+ antiporter
MAVGMGRAVLARAEDGAENRIVIASGLAEGFVGAILLGIVNGLPESVIAVAAARRAGAYPGDRAANVERGCIGDRLRQAKGSA